MKPIDYIYKNLGHLNMTVLKQLITDAGETVSEEIYDYLRETPWNTNTAILKEMGLDIERSKEGSIKKVIISGKWFGGQPGTIESNSDIKTIEELYNYLQSDGPIEIYRLDSNTGETYLLSNKSHIADYYIFDDGNTWDGFVVHIYNDQIATTRHTPVY